MFGGLLGGGPAPPTVTRNTTYRPPTYAPTAIVRELHSYYHHGGATEFEPANPAYQMAMAGFFALPLAIGLLLSVGFGVFQTCASRCESCCRCCIPQKTNWARRRMLLAAFLLANMALLCCSWIGRNDLQGAAATARQDGIKEL